MNFIHSKYFSSTSERKIFFLILFCLSLNSLAQKPSKDSVSILQGRTAEILSEAKIDLYQQDSTTAFYRKRNNKPAWKNREFRNEFISALKEAEAEGLYFKDYHGKEIEKTVNDYGDLNAEEQSRLDVLLTDAFFKFGRDMVKGRIDPAQIHSWGVPENELPLVSILGNAVETRNLEAAIQKIIPPFPIYQELVNASREYRRLKKERDPLEEIDGGKTLKKGDEDDRLPEIQKRLELLGYLDEKDSLSTVYTEEIEKAVREFQKEKRLQLDGIIGPGTITALNKGFEEKHRQILVNLERWRWYPRNLGEHFILTNIADFSMYVVKNKDTVRFHKVVVGRPERKTVIFSDTIEYLVYNPSWYIPPTIKREDVIPAVRSNPDYLRNNNMVVYDSNWQKLDPYAVDWGSSRVYSFNFKQNPGSSNPMGRVKIMYPNDYLIFSHDTPAQHLFENNVRAHSSGCVRVQNAVKLSKYLLEGEVSSEEIDNILSKEDKREIPLQKTVQIHHFYWTAWRENGKTRLIHDLYGYDEKIYKALNAD